MIFFIIVALLSCYCLFILYRIVVFYVQRGRLLPLFEHMKQKTDIFLRRLKSSTVVDETSIRRLIKASRGRDRITPDMLSGIDGRQKDLIVIYYILSIAYIPID